MRPTIPSPLRKAPHMSSILFSTFVGFITVIVTPMMAVAVVADTYRESTRRERLQFWQVAVLIGPTGLALWTYFWVRPYGEALLIAETPLWMFFGAGVTLSIALAGAQWLLGQRQRALEARLIEAVLRP